MLLIVVVLIVEPAVVQEEQDAPRKPNILIIFGDDIGFWNVSYNNDGMMGYQPRTSIV